MNQSGTKSDKELSIAKPSSEMISPLEVQRRDLRMQQVRIFKWRLEGLQWEVRECPLLVAFLEAQDQVCQEFGHKLQVVP